MPFWSRYGDDARSRQDSRSPPFVFDNDANSKALAATSLLVLGVSAVTHAQQTDTDTQRTVRNDDHDTDKGWVGLIGLAGLLGLRRKDRDRRCDRVARSGSRPRSE